MFKKYVLLRKVIGDGYVLVPLKVYQKNELLQCHAVVDVGTKRYLKRLWFL